MLVAFEDNIEVTLLVVPPINEIEEQPGILLIELTVAHFINNQAERPYQAVENGGFLASSPGCGKLVPQLRHLNEVGFNAPLTALVAVTQFGVWLHFTVYSTTPVRLVNPAGISDQSGAGILKSHSFTCDTIVLI